jgi:hypothetical protein
VPEEKPQVVNVAIGLAVLDEARVMFRSFAPVVVARMPVEQPKLPTEKSFAPIRPRFAAVFPSAVHGVHRKEIGIRFDEVAQLRPGEIKCATTFLQKVRADHHSEFHFD